MMEEKYGWEREYKDSNPCGNLLLSDYRREMATERAKIAELERLVEESKLAEVSKETAKAEGELERLGSKKVSVEEEIAVLGSAKAQAENALKLVREAIVGAKDNIELLNAETAFVGNRLSEYKNKLMEEKVAYEQLTADIADGTAKKEVIDEEILELRRQADSKMVDVRELL